MYVICYLSYCLFQTFTNDYSTFIPEVNVTEDPWVMHYFLYPFNARFFRIRPQTHKAETEYPILRFEVYGCLRELSSSGGGKVDTRIIGLLTSILKEISFSYISFHDCGFYSDFSKSIFFSSRSYIKHCLLFPIPFYLSICLFSPFVYESICISIYLYVFVYLLCLFIHLFFLFIHLCIYIPTYPSVYLSLYLSIYVCMYLSS